MRRKIEVRAALMFVEKIATDRVALNLRHYRLWELILARLFEGLKATKVHDIRDMERVAGILDRAQESQRLAKALSVLGETEETIRAEAQARVPPAHRYLHRFGQGERSG